jgi:hypothetical protein
VFSSDVQLGSRKILKLKHLWSYIAKIFKNDLQLFGENITTFEESGNRCKTLT